MTALSSLEDISEYIEYQDTLALMEADELKALEDITLVPFSQPDYDLYLTHEEGMNLMHQLDTNDEFSEYENPQHW